MSVLNKFEKKKKNAQGTVTTEKAFTLLISNEDIDDDIIIVQLLERSGLVIDGAMKQ